MTHTNTRQRRVTGSLFYCLLLLLAFPVLLYFSQRITQGVQDALLLCARVIIPSLFPFMILSEWLTCLLADNTIKAQKKRNIDAICRKIFGVSLVGMLPFAMGALCGFPLGVRCAVDLYRRGRLTATETEQAIAFSNNTGPAFLIAGVGHGLFKDKRIGLWLYVLQIACALLSGFLLHKLLPDSKRRIAPLTTSATTTDTSLATIIKKSTHSMLSVCGMIVAFSIPMSFAPVLLKNPVLLSFFCSFLEVGGASALAARLYVSTPVAAMLALTNAVCFGGLSVHLQAALFTREAGLSLRRHMLGKLLQATIACLALVICLIIT